MAATHHVHEPVFSTLAGNIVCLSLPVRNTNAPSDRSGSHWCVLLYQCCVIVQMCLSHSMTVRVNVHVSFCGE